MFNTLISIGAASRRVRNRLKDRANAFAREEDGLMTVMALFLFLALVGAAGIGVDLMRYEQKRAALQYTMDRAVLAAADLDQQVSPETVVRSYLEKAGLLEYLSSVTVQEGLGYRKVSATATAELPTHFMKLSGYDSLTIPAASTAEESIGNVEISLVLDVSGSMNSNSRLYNLKNAAKEFVDHMLSATEPGTVSISIVPYATQVNAGADILSYYNVSTEHNYSHCVNFIDDEFSQPGLSRVTPLERTMHFDPFSYTKDPISTPVCPVRASTEILPFSNDQTVLNNYIDGLTGRGNTSIDIGTKWGVVMLDPGTQSVISGLISDNKVPASFQGRPSAYDSGDVLKVLIVMSDGENTNQYMLNPSLRDGDSPVWYNAAEDVISGSPDNNTTNAFSIYHDNGNNSYYWPDQNRWADHPYGNGQSEACGYNSSGYYSCAMRDEPGEAVRLTYAELFAKVSLAYNAYYNFEFNSNAWAEWYTAAMTHKEASAKDQRTDHVCDAAKDEGIIVYTVGFEAPYSGRRVLKRCASSDSHYYDADGLEISDAFTSIASSIRKLRLTQ
ncbi:TadE/TadG family protein [Ruegeria pomeroyi]|uniref:TadE/TadG family protein n=2 Tax=Ruegeria pomeroyi TaxID=89184 RepID=A0A850LJF2_9RHOB|nr:TadE/TadG family protein [Ruegeria pomeroyi]NVL00603.1 TadE/TadG family protein [Ruegeria pomeroyi]QWV11080.1 TadE/TadG family protein [Ruegeria pomeroyi]HCE71922.1 hypothetical protein [Ruegeria sp.]